MPRRKVPLATRTIFGSDSSPVPGPQRREGTSPKPKTPGQKAAATKKRKAAAKKAVLTKKAAAKLKHRKAGEKAAQTKKRRTAAKKAQATIKAKKLAAAPPEVTSTVGKIQERYGMSKEDAHREIENWNPELPSERFPERERKVSYEQLAIIVPQSRPESRLLCFRCVLPPNC